MGGGAVLRGVGRAISMGGASTRGGIGSASQQVATPKKSWGAAGKASVSSSSSCYVAPEEEGFVDNCVFAGEGEAEGLQTRHHQVQLEQQPLVRDCIIFGTMPVPTRQEVVEATSDMQNALKQTFTSVSNTFGQDKDKMLQKSGHSNVFEAFNLIQNNLSVQEMVNSLASDEAVWEAMLKNEKVMEFRQQLLKDESELPETNKDAGKPSPGKHPLVETIETVKAEGMIISLASDEAAWEAVLKNEKVIEFRQQLLKDESELSESNKDTDKHPFIQAFETVKAKVIEYMDRITELCNLFFGGADKGLSDKGPEYVKALKASWVLCIVVLLMVLVKRK